jgi:hypothetical protein
MTRSRRLGGIRDLGNSWGRLKTVIGWKGAMRLLWRVVCWGGTETRRGDDGTIGVEVGREDIDTIIAGIGAVSTDIGMEAIGTEREDIEVAVLKGSEDEGFRMLGIGEIEVVAERGEVEGTMIGMERREEIEGEAGNRKIGEGVAGNLPRRREKGGGTDGMDGFNFWGLLV